MQLKVKHRSDEPEERHALAAEFAVLNVRLLQRREWQQLAPS